MITRAEGLVRFTSALFSFINLLSKIMSLIKTGAEALTVTELFPLASITTTAGATGIDVRALKGLGRIVLTHVNVAGTSPTLALKIQQSSDDGSADAYTDITGATFTGATDANDGTQSIMVDLDQCEGYIRLHHTIGGTVSPEFSVYAALIARAEGN